VGVQIFAKTLDRYVRPIGNRRLALGLLCDAQYMKKSETEGATEAITTLGGVLAGRTRPRRSLTLTQTPLQPLSLEQRLQKSAIRGENLNRLYVAFIRETRALLDEIAADCFGRYPDLVAFGFTSHPDSLTDERCRFNLDTIRSATLLVENSQGELDSVDDSDERTLYLRGLLRSVSDSALDDWWGLNGWTVVFTQEGEIAFDYGGSVTYGEDREDYERLVRYLNLRSA